MKSTIHLVPALSGKYDNKEVAVKFMQFTTTRDKTIFDMNKEIQSLDNARVEEIAGAGIKLFVDGKRILVGNKKLMKSYSIDYQKHKNVGTILYLAVNKEYYGCVVIRDEIKENAYELFINFLSFITGYLVEVLNILLTKASQNQKDIFIINDLFLAFQKIIGFS